MADSSYIINNIDTKQPKKLKQIDNGDGTYSLHSSRKSLTSGRVLISTGVNILIAAVHTSSEPPLHI